MKRKNLSRTAFVAALAIGLGGCSGGLFGGGGDKKVTPTLGNRQPILSRIETGAQVDPALAGVPFDSILAALGDELYDHQSGRGRYILYNVGCLDSYGKLDVIAVGKDMDDASYGLEELLPELLKRVA